MTHIDRELELALDSGAGPLDIFAKFKPKGTKSATLFASQLMTRVAKLTKESPRFDYRDLDSVLHVRANRQFIRELIRQPEIVSASMVPDRGSAMIEPVHTREAQETEISRPTYPRRHLSGRR